MLRGDLSRMKFSMKSIFCSYIYVYIYMLPPWVIYPFWVDMTELAHGPGCDASRFEDLTERGMLGWCEGAEGIGMGAMPPKIPKDHRTYCM